MTEYAELKPCPFCGGSVRLEQPADRAPRDDWWGVVCRNTENLGGTCAIEQRPSRTKEAAVERWNRRAPDATLLARAEKAEKERDEAVREAELNTKSKIRLAFRKALSSLPEIAPPEVRPVLSSVLMRDEFINEGKRLQREHGVDAVAPRVEQECGAGAWSFMRAGVLSALEPSS